MSADDWVVSRMSIAWFPPLNSLNLQEFVAPTFNLCPGKTVDFIPCLDNEKAIAALTSRKHYEHRERHCPTANEREELRCLLPMPAGYKQHIRWPQSRDEVSDGGCSASRKESVSESCFLL